jgi:hypothetical protein
MAINRFSQSSVQNAFPKYNSLWDGVSAAGGMDAISHITLGASASSITFNSIPSTYTHLQVRYIARSDSATTTINLNMTHNSDFGSNYSWHRLYGNGTTVGSSGGASTTVEIIAQVPAASIASSVFGLGVIDIVDYANTSKNKTSKTLGGWEDNAGSGPATQLFSGCWYSTTAINTLTFTLSSSSNFVQYSSFALYGVK